MERGKENLISIEEIIRKAKELGVDFGKGDPKNRLRYYTKIGLIPHAQRTSFGGRSPTGAYPERIITVLVLIDKKLKEGKSILQIKRELEKEKREIPFCFETEKVLEISPFENGKEIKVLKKRKIDFQKIFKKNLLGILISLSLISFFSGFFTNNEKKLSGSQIGAMLVSPLLQPKVAQLPPRERERERAPLVSSYEEPFLTINADTQVNGILSINGSLSIRDDLSFQRQGYKAIFGFETLTKNRNYTFPDASGIVCLTSGNCFGIFGEVKTAGGTSNRVARFAGPNEISNSSISDFYTRGISLAISETGNVGIGTENPRYKLHVTGRIQATGDICTDLGGRKCLSQLVRFFGVAPTGGGIGGSGSPGTLALWTNPTAL